MKRGCLSFFLGFWAISVFGGAKPSCLESCLIEHPLWGYPRCAKTSPFYIEGIRCYEVYSDCSNQCEGSNPWGIIPYLKRPFQWQDEWRPQRVCSSVIQKIPITLLPADDLIAPQWSGRCECLKGTLIEVSCHHPAFSCRVLCNPSSSTQ